MIRKPIKLKEVWYDYTVCMECGKKMGQLVMHLKLKHNMTTTEYKEKYPGFPLQCGQVAGLSKGMSNPNYKNGSKVKEELVGKEGHDYVVCQECGKKVRMLTTSGHLHLHSMTREEYQSKYPGSPVTCMDFKENTNSLLNLTFEERSQRAIKGLKGRKFGHNTLTKPHKEVNKILKSLKRKHSNEVVFLGRNIDIQLSDTHFIEVQGDYWHCNPLKYQEPKDQNQERKIGLDVIKAKIFKRKHINILYLWESDILNRPTTCKILIQKYIRNELTNFHSFNYTDEGELKDDLIDFYY